LVAAAEQRWQWEELGVAVAAVLAVVRRVMEMCAGGSSGSDSVCSSDGRSGSDV
jgi:hypothetical protein